MKIRRIIIAGLIAGIASFVVGSLLYMNPLVAGIYDQYKNLPGIKSMEVFGGVANWLISMALGGVLFTVIDAFIFALIYKSLPSGRVRKGIIFGLLIFLIGALPTSYYTYLMRDYPNILIMIEAFNGLVGALTAGLLIAWVYKEK